jgi:hypothetical protein
MYLFTTPYVMFVALSISEPEIVSPWNHQTADYVMFEVFTAVTMKNAVFLDVTPCGSCKNGCFGGI